MSKAKCEELSSLRRGKTECKIKVRVVRQWRGVSKTGEVFKAFNLMLLDHKNNRMHAFVPTVCVDELEHQLTVGQVYIIRNFTVQGYKEDDKFRCLKKDIQLIFSLETQIKTIQDDCKNMAANAFDFYDHSELLPLAKQTTYLADVVGIIKHRQPIADLVNRHGKEQKQSKFTITDGSSNVKVTFWDGFALKFEKQMLEDMEQPVIIIIASCRVGLWNGELDLSAVAATECFMNYNHYSVNQLRKMLGKPGFKKQVFAMERQSKVELVKIANITTLGAEYIQMEIMAHVKICSVEEAENWYSDVCTSCDTKIEKVNGEWFCEKCNHMKPYPDKKFNISVVASDETGGIKVVLGDQQVRTIVGKRVTEFIKEAAGDESFPRELEKIVNQNYTMKLIIKDVNVLNNIQIYWATNICKGFIQPMQPSVEPTSTSSYHLDGMSQLNCQSTMSTSKSLN